MPTATDANRIAKAHTPLGKGLVFRQISGREELSRPFEYRLELLAENNSNVDPKKLLGQGITVEILIQGKGKRYVHGECVRFAYLGTEFAAERNIDLWRYEAVLRPWLWYLTRTSTCKIFQKETVPKILDQIFGKYPFQVEKRLTRQYREWDYCVQYEETDFNFVSRLMEHEGIYYWFEHAMGNCTLVLTDDISRHVSLPGYATIPHIPPDMMVKPDEEWIDHWQMAQEVDAGRYYTDDYDYKKPSADLKTTRAQDLPFQHGSYEIYDWPGGFVEPQPWGEQYVRDRIEELQQPKERTIGESNARGLSPGYTFTLEKCPRRDQDREYLLLAVDMYLRDNPYTTGGTGPADWKFTLQAQPTSHPYRPARSTPKPQIAGPQTAVVTGPSGEEIYTDSEGLGRVKVHFHWDRDGRMDENSSCWVRVSSAWAGANWGQISLPRIGQEVIVEFIDGDPDYPIITGRVYNAEQMPPWDLPKHKTQSGILSRSTKKGTKKLANMIRMEDDKGNEEIHVHAQRNLVEVVENDEIKEVQANRHEHIKKDHIEKVAGNMQLLVGPDGGNQDIYIKSKKTETIGADNDFHVKGSRKEKVDGSTSLTVGGDQQEKVGNKHAVESGMEIHLKAGMKVIIEAGLQLTLKAAGGFVDIGPAGVTIQGNMVLINSGGSAGSGSGSSPETPSDAREADPSGPSEE